MRLLVVLRFVLFVAVAVLVLVAARKDGASAHRAASSACGSERWTVKTLQDQPTLLPVTKTTVAYRVSRPAPAVLPDARLPFERHVFRVVAQVVLVRQEADSDFHLVLQDQGQTMIAEAADPACAPRAMLPRARLGGTGQRRLPVPSVAAIPATAVLLLVSACGDSKPRARLSDGSPAERVPSALKHLGAAALPTTVRTGPFRSLDPRERACITLTTGLALAPDQPFVERVDHFGSSVTFRPRGGPFVIGCTSGSTRSGTKKVWCGHVVGEIRGGHLVDPRFDIACRTAAGEPVGSAWIEPVHNARWIVVRDHDLTQVYPVATGAGVSLPVRVTTLSADIPTATGVFRVEQVRQRRNPGGRSNSQNGGGWLIFRETSATE